MCMNVLRHKYNSPLHLNAFLQEIKVFVKTAGFHSAGHDYT